MRVSLLSTEQNVKHAPKHVNNASKLVVFAGSREKGKTEEKLHSNAT